MRGERIDFRSVKGHGESSCLSGGARAPGGTVTANARGADAGPGFLLLPQREVYPVRPAAILRDGATGLGCQQNYAMRGYSFLGDMTLYGFSAIVGELAHGLVIRASILQYESLHLLRRHALDHPDRVARLVERRILVRRFEIARIFGRLDHDRL